MRIASIAVAALWVAALSAAPAFAQEKNQVKPLLRLEAGGPTSNVTSLAFSPDGKTLYVAGYDKVVRTWKLKNGKFELDDATSFRVPIGPGIDGAINAIAVSDDGQWLAVGGFGVVGEGMKFTEAGRLIPTKGGLTPELRLERGQILVFNTRDRSVKTLRGHSGPTLSLAFAGASDDSPRLISASEGWDADAAKANGEAKVWDILKEQEISGLTMPPLTFARRPGVALLASRDALQAFLAWENGTLIRWDVTGRKTETLAAPKQNIALELFGTSKLLMTGMDGVKGVIKSLDLATGRMTTDLELPGTADEYDLPIAARLCGRGLYLAVVVRHWNKGAATADSLWIVRNHQGAWNAPVAKLPLAEKNVIVPTLAGSEKWVAVGGFADHRVAVFDIEDAIRAQAVHQTLRSAGATMRSVAFVKNGDGRGLAVGEKAGAKDAVFDIDGRKLVTDTAGWADDSAGADGYLLQVGQNSVTLSKANQVLSTVTIKSARITATAVLPPGVIETPLIAIASFKIERGSTLLELYDGQSGRPLRSFAGHTAPITSLAFRADGKLLASTADDQTTIVWSLTDLGDVLGKHGSFGDLAVETRGKDLTVIDPAGTPNINTGDLVRGLYDKAGKLNPLATPATFYEAVWMKKPNQNVKLRINRGGLEQDTELAVKQGVDVRKPLFTLFFPRGQGGKLGDWLGWNNIGPYDSSRKEVEQYLGWHFNTGRPEQPTSFAFIDQYRKEYFRPGVLKEMAALGDLPPPPKPPLPKPAVLAPGVEVDGKLLTKVGGEYLLRKKAFDLTVTIPAYEPVEGDVLTYQLDNGPALPMEQSNINSWSATVAVEGAEPTRRVTIRMKRTPEGWPAQEYRSDVALRVIAPPPSIVIDRPKTPEPIKVDQAEYVFKAAFAPGEPGVSYRASIAQESLGRVVASKDLKSGQAGELSAKWTLEPGLNVLQVRAVNDRAVGRPHEEEEAATATVNVLFEPRKVPPPTIAFRQIAPPDTMSGKGATPISGRRVRYESAKAVALLSFDVKSEEPITSVEVDTDKKDRQPAKVEDGHRTGLVALKPGPQVVRVFAKTKSGVEAIAEQEIDFRPPPLGDVAIVNLEEGFQVAGETATLQTPLQVQFAAPALDYKLPVKVEATVNSGGKTISTETMTVDASAGAAKFDKLTLDHGANTIRVSLYHEFGVEVRVAEVHGHYVRPPKIASLTAPVGKAPFVDVTAEVISAADPAAEYVTVLVNGRAARPRAVEIKKGAGVNAWTIVAKETPIAAVKGKAAKSDIAMSLLTTDGEAKASLKEPVVFSLPFAPAPEIALLEPALREATLAEPVMKLRFNVTSDAPLSRVDVARGDKVIKKWEAIPPATDGVYEFALDDVALEWGVNGLSLSAWNEGGVRMSPLSVNVPQQPVRLDLEQVELAAGLKLKPGVDGGFAPLPTGRVTLHGSVRWNSNNDALLSKAKQVRMFVNGFQQLPVDMKGVAGKERERKFQFPVVLNFSDNQVEVDLPELKQDAANRRKFTVPCLQPIRGQQLHILVIAPQERDEAKLVESLTRGLKASPIGNHLYKTPVFDVVRFYVLAKHVQLVEVSSRLDRIAESLKERARAGHPNDLVMIYFQGKETADSTGPILWTSESAPWLQLTVKDLSKNYLSRFSGGQVLILDTVSKAGDIDFRDVRFAYMRRPDPRPLMDASRPRFSTELEKEMPQVVWLDQLTTILAAQVRPTFQSNVPEPLRNRIQLNPN